MTNAVWYLQQKRQTWPIVVYTHTIFSISNNDFAKEIYQVPRKKKKKFFEIIGMYKTDFFHLQDPVSEKTKPMFIWLYWAVQGENIRWI